nr:hypothetical protein [Tsukamurella tyrosinosolvens]
MIGGFFVVLAEQPEGLRSAGPEGFEQCDGAPVPHRDRGDDPWHLGVRAEHVEHGRRHDPDGDRPGFVHPCQPDGRFQVSGTPIGAVVFRLAGHALARRVVDDHDP